MVNTATNDIIYATLARAVGHHRGVRGRLLILSITFFTRTSSFETLDGSDKLRHHSHPHHFQSYSQSAC